MAPSNETGKPATPPLPFGAISRIARALGVSQQHVSAVYRGERSSPRVEEALAEAIAEYRRALEATVSQDSAAAAGGA